LKLHPLLKQDSAAASEVYVTPPFGRGEACIKCDGLAIRLGLCGDHYREWMQQIWEGLVRDGQTRPIPPCWQKDENAWREYQVLARAAMRKLRSHCADCLPEFKNKSLANGTCNRPETIFVMRRLENREPEMVGLNRDFPLAFLRACRGSGDEIIHDAPRVAKNAVLAAVRAEIMRPGQQTDDEEQTEGDGELLPPLASLSEGELVAAAGGGDATPPEAGVASDDGGAAEGDRREPPYPFCCHPDKCIEAGRCERRVGGELRCCAD
jgi:hypothetical protein